MNNHKIGDTDADLGMYAETDWKARKNLTISYGFRYETQNHLPTTMTLHRVWPSAMDSSAARARPRRCCAAALACSTRRFGQGNVLTLEQENGVNTTMYTVENPSAACNPSATELIAACGATSTAQTTYTAASNLRTPYIEEFAIGADQQVGRNGTLSDQLCALRRPAPAGDAEYWI